MASEVTQETVPATPLVPQEMSEKPTIDEFVRPTAASSVLQTPFVQRFLPFLTSLALHILIVILLWATYTVAEKVYTVVKEQIIIPDSALVDEGPVGGIQNPGLGEDPNREAAQDQIADVSADASGWASSPSETLDSLPGGSSGNSDAMIGVGSGGGFGSGDSGIGSGSGKGGGPLAPFGVPGGGEGIGPKSQFMGVGGNAMKIAYVCDASGTMFNAMDALRQQLYKSIADLKPVQGFNLFFFGGDGMQALQKGGLVMARTDNKRKAREFIARVNAVGSTNPFPAIEAAFATKPDLIYILTDGFDNVASYDDIVSLIARLNPDRKVKVNAILIQTRADSTLESVMQKIATDNGGRFIIVPSSEMTY